MPVEDVVGAMRTDLHRGLEPSEAQRRRLACATGISDDGDDEGIFSKVVDNLKDPTIMLLLASMAVSCVLGQWDDAAAIGVAVALVVGIGVAQEMHADKAVAALRDLAPARCRVIRAGHVQEVDAASAVPGDVVLLAAGDRVPADMRITAAASLRLDESVLTGEADAQTKRQRETPEGAALAERSSMAFLGTLAVAGHGRGVVTAVGPQSVYGSIKELIERASKERRRSVLQEQMDALGQRLSVASIGLIIVIGAIGLWRGRNWLDTVQVAISLAVAAIPEGLPVVTTVTLAVGVQRLAAEKAVCRRLQALTDLGSSRLVVVTDKTGTLTQNRMRLEVAYLAPPAGPGAARSGPADVGAVALSERAGGAESSSHGVVVAAKAVASAAGRSGSGQVVAFLPDSGAGSDTGTGPRVPWELLSDSSGHSGAGGPATGRKATADSNPVLFRLLHGAALCSNAHSDGAGGVIGPATEVALVEAAHEAGLLAIHERHERIAEVPFSSDRKWMAVQVRELAPGAASASAPEEDVAEAAAAAAAAAAGSGGGGEGDDGAPTCLPRQDGAHVWVKGAPERVLAMCGFVAGPDGVAMPLSAAGRADILAAQAAASGCALRVLAVAEGAELTEADSAAARTAGDSAPASDQEKRPSGGPGHVTRSVPQGLTFVGLVALMDPPRPTAGPSVALLRACGIRSVMLTGDAEQTARAVARLVGIEGVGEDPEAPPTAVSGASLDAASELDLGRLVGAATVFYRVSPAHKLRVVKALQARGLTVACFGDGVNDAPALRAADVGVAMGLHGTQVAREAADVVLLDDRFETLVRGVEAGRSIFRNVRAFVRFQVASSIALLVLVTVCYAAGADSPLNATMVLMANVLIDGPPAQTLGLEHVEPASVRKPARREDEHILTPRLFARTALTAVIMSGALLGSYWRRILDGVVSRRDSTLVFATFVVLDMASAYVARCGDRPLLSVPVLGNKPFAIATAGVLAFLALAVHAPPLQAVFSTEAIRASDWLFILALAAAVILADELAKPFLAEPAAAGPAVAPASRTGEAGARLRTESDEQRLLGDVSGRGGSESGATLSAGAANVPGDSPRVRRRGS
ncbi:hypothetical protein FNF27_03095 [Cafeteria roenbergensis]|uniref:Cation-transporting P-type ATPase N-terminal domain-containing protein n=1 Tax=Cafeteria roenbergensis TaxID=33653 RepID=A0A5A8CDH6_CAFRO|nr:hypothetical protein FNF29_05056 [Cafeteria roenbergensis]KAA0175395.1 hypothetical protein FNF27_03095 [Cafeteria roenbergensis]|eukprot:KAA0150719.1 hypothetical protein FNF29_05056 [Cafeteria roenbergensis]